MRIVRFRPHEAPVYTYWDVEDHEVKARYSDDTCKPLFTVVEGRLTRLYIESGGHSYKLCSANEGWAPTLAIDGIVMHTVLDDPIRYSEVKLSLIKRFRGVVLDCCTGLGYTALVALRRGARLVFSVEADENVLELARYNPWSRHLSDDRVELAIGDIYDALSWLRDGLVNVVIHDPPRPTKRYLPLYSLELYRLYMRVLSRGGLLYHYTPMSGSKFRGVNLRRGIVNRLREAGFIVIGSNEYGVLAKKPG